VIFVICGPGGAGKGTIVQALIERDADLWLSRSWTTRERREGEDPDSYVWVTPEQFRARAEAGGFLEWAEFLGNLYGTPTPDPPPGKDVVLEIDIQGATQVKAKYPESVCVLVEPPSREVQEARLRGRGDPEDKIQQRLLLADREEWAGRQLADHVVVNDDLARVVDQVAGIIATCRSRGAR
jgi:guanylate kinase